MIPIIGSEYVQKVVPLINGAIKSIDILMYDWRWYLDRLEHPVQEFNRALVHAVSRGVRVRCLTNTDLLTKQLNDLKIKARTLKDERVLHAKIIIIDEKFLVIGSHNLTSNAFTRNLETSVILEIPQGQDRFQQFFNNLYGL
jgi:phosphatidylserine/phosphatidylglycerophosphate/cardiolipin synthase-like enzyme